MPVLGAEHMAGYEKARKALEKEVEERTIADRLSAALNKVRLAVQKGDPKTEYSKGENRQHAKASPVSHSKRLDLSHPDAATEYIVGSTIQVHYRYDTGDPYNKVVVTYDVTYDVRSKKPLSATGYVRTLLNSVPDLSGMTLTSSAIRSDGTKAFENYQSSPDATGAYTHINVTYDSGGNVSSVTQMFIQPLDLRKVKLPKLA